MGGLPSPDAGRSDRPGHAADLPHGARRDVALPRDVLGRHLGCPLELELELRQRRVAPAAVAAQLLNDEARRLFVAVDLVLALQADPRRQAEVEPAAALGLNLLERRVEDQLDRARR